MSVVSIIPVKTRIIRTKFWQSSSTLRLPKEARYLGIYILTSPHIGLCGIFELPDNILMLETAFTPSELQQAKSTLEKANKMFFYEDWVWVVNHDKHNPYYLSPKTAIAYKKEMGFIPQLIRSYFTKKALLLDSTIDSSMDSTPNKETINNKPETINQKEIEKAKENVRQVMRDKGLY